MEYKLCVSSSIAPFRNKAEKIWKLERYKFPNDIFKPLIFFGMYHIGDYFHYLRHFGTKSIFWCGSDIVNLKKGYGFSDGKILWFSRLTNWIPWHWIFRIIRAKHFVENEIEQKELLEFGLRSIVSPSFLEDIDNFPIYFKPSERPQVYLSARPGREKEYGVELVERIAPKVPNVIFHIYGYDVPEPYTGIAYDNIIYEGKVSEEKFNEDIRNYHCGFRPNFHNGFSEIIAKSVLMGQYPISRIQYPMIDSYETEEELIKLLKCLKTMKEPNLRARNYWRENANDYPWIKK